MIHNMAKRIHGYMTDDGTFFETIVMAEYHEARVTLNNTLRQDKIDADKLITIMLDHFEEVKNVVAAINKCKVAGYTFDAEGNAVINLTAISDTGESIDTEGTRSTTPLVEQPFDQFKSVPDIRARSQRKTVRPQQPSDGTRSRKSDA